jgi:carboxylesterase
LTESSTEFVVRGATREQVQPFKFDRGPIGCVLLHGFTAAPKEMRPLGQYLAELNYTVRGVRLAGHGTSPQDLARTPWRDWVASAEGAIDELRGRCDRVWIIGLSLGGLIGLYLAARQRIDGVIALAPPIFTLDKRVRFARFIWPFKPYSAKDVANLHDPQALAGHADYPLNPTRAVAQLNELMRRTRHDLRSINVPVLVIQSRQDQVVSPAGPDYILERVRSTAKEKRLLDRGGHIIPEDYDKEVAFEAIHQFLQRHTGAASRAE